MELTGVGVLKVKHEILMFLLSPVEKTFTIGFVQRASYNNK